MDEDLGGLGQMPLQVATEARVVVEEAEQDGRLPFTSRCQHPAPRVVEGGVPRSVAARDFAAQHLAPPGCGSLRLGLDAPALAHQSGCKVEELQHHGAERLEHAIAIKMVVGWRIQLMVRLGREVPAKMVLSAIELRVLAAFARPRSVAPPQHLGGAVELLARLGGRLRRTRDPPGAQRLWHGYPQLAAVTFAFELRDETG